MRKRYSRSYTVLSFLTMFSYRELPLAVFCFMEQGTGIEPASVAWEATVLPMN